MMDFMSTSIAQTKFHNDEFPLGKNEEAAYDLDYLGDAAVRVSNSRATHGTGQTGSRRAPGISRCH
jgi:hypothetical protein